jgi:hypothetical protein
MRGSTQSMGSSVPDWGALNAKAVLGKQAAAVATAVLCRKFRREKLRDEVILGRFLKSVSVRLVEGLSRPKILAPYSGLNAHSHCKRKIY